MANYVKTYKITLDGATIHEITVPSDYDVHNLVQSVLCEDAVMSQTGGKKISAIRPDLENNLVQLFTYKKKPRQ